MAARSSTRPTRSTPLAAVLLAPLLLAACAATSGAAAPANSTAPTAMASASPGGPVEYALWIERQGFGGSSGLRQVLKSANWVNDNASWATVSDVETEMSYAERLAGWLDKHPATACWTDYHATVRATLDRVLAGFAAARDARAAGQRVPLEVGATLVSEAQSAFDLPAPAGC
jgi:hypothetical protein